MAEDPSVYEYITGMCCLCDFLNALELKCELCAQPLEVQRCPVVHEYCHEEAMKDAEAFHSPGRARARNLVRALNKRGATNGEESTPRLTEADRAVMLRSAIGHIRGYDLWSATVEQSQISVENTRDGREQSDRPSNDERRQ